MSGACSPFDFIDYNVITSNSATALELDRFMQSNTGKFKEITLQRTTNKINELLSIYNKGSSRPSLEEKFTLMPFNSVEVADFLYYNNYDIDSLLSTVTEYVTNYPLVDLVVSNKIEDVLNNLDNFVEKSLGIKKDSSNFCSSLSSFYNKLMRSVSLLQNVFNAVSDLANLNIESLIGSINAQIAAIKDMILSKIDGIIKKVTAKIQNIVQQITNLPAMIGAKLNKFANDVKMIFSSEGIENLKNNVKKIVSEMSSQFIVFTAENIMTLLMRMCQMMSFIDKLLNGKVDEVSNIASIAQSNIKVFAEVSRGNIDIINSLGIPFLSFDERKAAVESFANSSPVYVNRDTLGNAEMNRDTLGNAEMPSNFGGYISLSNAVKEEEDWLNSLTTKNANSVSSGLLLFGDGVLKMAQRAKSRYEAGQGDKSFWDDAQNYFSEDAGIDAGLENCKLNDKMPLVRIRRVAKMLGVQLSINSAYRSDFYQSTLGGEKAPPGSSPHRTGYAMDVTPPWNDEMGGKFVEMCSREGFTRIAIYPSESFFHIDFHPQNSWAKTMPNAGLALGPKTAKAMERHRNGEFR